LLEERTLFFFPFQAFRNRQITTPPKKKKKKLYIYIEDFGKVFFFFFGWGGGTEVGEHAHAEEISSNSILIDVN